jgi:N-acetylglucosaminyldiphosphoundecaprenol N-acetyl-beta-D-mannosaminyltransferase
MKDTILDYKVFEGQLDNIDLKEKCIINTINLHSYVVAKKDEIFRNALQSSDVLLPDGIGIVHAWRILRKKKIKKVAGYDAFRILMEKVNNENGSCFFLGSSTNTLKLIEEKIKEEYKNVEVNSISPPFKPSFTKEDNVILLREIEKFQPDVLFVGMTAPKQEKWVFENKNMIKANVICSIGAVFDFYAGTIERPSKIWIDLGLEWFMRFLQNPKKMFPRVFVSTPIFLKDLLLEKLRAK